MSVLIKGMEMPTCGATMNLIFPNGDVRGMKYGSGQWELLGQAIDLPPHGRLGDLDELLDRAFGCLDEETFLAFQFLVNGSITIIPADKEGE